MAIKRPTNDELLLEIIQTSLVFPVNATDGVRFKNI